MINEFSRTELLIGEEKLHILKGSTVMVLGIGGVGSHCAEALARCGVGRLVLVDNDKVSLTNINRQSVAAHSTVGRLKTDVMRERIKDICPDTDVVTYETFVLPDNVELLFGERPDYIIDAIDTVTAKLAVVQKAVERGIPIISSMGTGNKLHAESFEIADISKTSVCPLCKVMRKELRARGIRHLKVLYSTEKPVDISARETEEEKGSRRSLPGSISFVPPVAGLLIAGEAVRDMIAKGPDPNNLEGGRTPGGE
ncbi:tRNA threonylcarbamoyladenosine dehydratase [Dorea sp. D27]|uniref:tRNA threonylcarbamoyladenosine dehydratase n=1 Tax=Dorea sp. D27 TaxID=658665 RepID=UPI000673AFA1|nr:tRNA threonylcarbamoyladenosine dehydratase [Dorea sp. D27]KMZ55227.1 ThiF family protein [Dorea sp. D27]